MKKIIPILLAVVFLSSCLYKYWSDQEPSTVIKKIFVPAHDHQIPHHHSITVGKTTTSWTTYTTEHIPDEFTIRVIQKTIKGTLVCDFTIMKEDWNALKVGDQFTTGEHVVIGRGVFRHYKTPEKE